MTQAQHDGSSERAEGGTDSRGARARRFLSARARPLVVSLAAGIAVVLSGTFGSATWNAFGRTAVASDDRAQMVAAERVVDSLRASAYTTERRRSAQSRLTGAALVALTYHERLRLGVGSPFRLADYATRDPRLGTALGRTTAWSILAKTARGTNYQVDPAALASRTERLGGRLGQAVLSATRHQALIDSTVGAAQTARLGEEVVRLALTLAQAERLIDARSASAGVHVAALARDRRLAIADARRLFDAARRSEDDALTLLGQWRAERRFTVEQPLLADASHSTGLDVVRGAAALLTEMRRAATASADDTSDVARVSRAFALRSYLPAGVAQRLAMSDAIRAAPPQAPVVVPANGARRRFVSVDRYASPDVDEARQFAAAVRRRFVDRVRTEESLAAEHAAALGALLEHADRVRTRDTTAGFDSANASRMPRAVHATRAAYPALAAAADVADVTLAAAVAFRAYAQEPAWFPEFGAPSDAELQARFGLRRVVFDAGIPAGWRPYYRQMLASALAELRGVLPSLSFDGLTVRVGESVKRDSALALHDPATRTVYLPTGTGAGTIAHEIAHDLDWQAARTWFALRGTYSTDRAARDAGRGVSEPLGNASLSRSVRGLTAARPRSAGGAGGRRVARVPERPAELFARGVDWLVAAALAREGRLNGYLTSVQDATLPGYAGVIAPEGGDRAADAVVEVLEDMTVLPSVTRTWYLARFGESASPGPESVARLALSSGPSYSSERALRALGLLESMGVADRAAVASRRATAGVGGACAPSAREPWRAELLWMAAESRARGMLRERALRGGGVVVPARWSWEAQATVGGPWNPAYGEAAVRRARDAILRQAVREDDARGPGGRLGVAALVFGGCG